RRRRLMHPLMAHLANVTPEHINAAEARLVDAGLATTITSLIAWLDVHHVGFDLDDDGALAVEAQLPRHVAALVEQHRPLLVAAVLARETCKPTKAKKVHHVWAPCSQCGEAALVAHVPAAGAPCRSTPRCTGKHRPARKTKAAKPKRTRKTKEHAT
ncbi:MAG TPA: hypothetical protein VF640_00735, partial [Acidimicrobiales bacterium]